MTTEKTINNLEETVGTSKNNKVDLSWVEGYRIHFAYSGLSLSELAEIIKKSPGLEPRVILPIYNPKEIYKEQLTGGLK